jgi:nucleoside-diphosphate-sugar epimerase
MKVLVTGNLGYIGTVLTQELIKEKFNVTGLDAGYFKSCKIDKTQSNFKQIIKDIRKIQYKDVEGFDSIIHLAALSNDPLGEINSKLTYNINYLATIRLAKLAKLAKVKRFIYASTQSIYGISRSIKELSEDGNNKNPITEYAKTKWLSEINLRKISDKNFTICFLRPSTVFGPSPRFRSDIVLNNLMASAYTSKKIIVKSDGSPYRPVIHIKDVCNAFISCLKAPSKLINNKAYNVGFRNGNFTIKQIAEEIKRKFSKKELIFTKEHGKDSRSYKVSFTRILKDLKNYYKPRHNIRQGIIELNNFFNRINFKKNDFNSWRTVRLIQLNKLIKKSKVK